MFPAARITDWLERKKLRVEVMLLIGLRRSSILSHCVKARVLSPAAATKASRV
jgi:hypothetical protein